MQTGVRHGRIQIRDIARIIKEALKGICRELLAEPRAVIDLPVPVVDESCAVNASLIIFTEYHIYSLPIEQTDEILPVARQPCMASATPFRIFGCHFLFLYSRVL